MPAHTTWGPPGPRPARAAATARAADTTGRRTR